MIIYLSLLVAVIGLVMFFACEKDKWVAVGKIMFTVGLLAFLLTDSQLLNLLHR